MEYKIGDKVLVGAKWNRHDDSILHGEIVGIDRGQKHKSIYFVNIVEYNNNQWHLDKDDFELDTIYAIKEIMNDK